MITVNGIDITDSVTDISVSQQVNAGAAMMSFSVLKGESKNILNGDTVVLSDSGETLFKGKVFSRSLSRDTANITALDSIRALNAVFPVLRAEQPASDFIKTLIALAAPEVKMGEIETIAALVGEKRFERISLIELIYRTIDEVEAEAGKYILIDEAGSVCLKNEKSLSTDLVLDGANVLELKYEHSAGQSCNYVKLTSNSVENALSASAVVSDGESIATFGRCCYIAELDESNPEQLMLKAKALLEQNSGEKEKLSLTAVGDMRAKAGSLVFVDLDTAGRFWARIISAQHRFEGKRYTVTLQLQRV